MAKRAAKKTTKRKGAAKKPIESYDHTDKKRANNPPVRLVTPDTNRDAGRNFLPLPQWLPGQPQPADWPSDIHPPREVQR